MRPESLHFIASLPPSRSFETGDQVNVVDRTASVVATGSIVAVHADHVQTHCGRMWALDGRWFDGRNVWPFPSIRLQGDSLPQHVAAAGVALVANVSEDGRTCGALGRAFQLLLSAPNNERSGERAGEPANVCVTVRGSVGKALALLLTP